MHYIILVAVVQPPIEKRAIEIKQTLFLVDSLLPSQTIQTKDFGTTNTTTSTYRISIFGQLIVIKDIGNIINHLRLVGCSTDIFEHWVALGTTNHLAFFSSKKRKSKAKCSISRAIDCIHTVVIKLQYSTVQQRKVQYRVVMHDIRSTYC